MTALRRSERVQFAGSGGNLLAGIVDQPQADPRAAVIFTHCFTCTKDLKAVVRISRELASAGFAVLRYDLSGLGNSQGDFSHSNFTTNRQDLLAAADFMASAYQPAKFLVGHSFGGACSLATAAEIPTIEGVVSLAAPSDTSHLADLLERMNPAIKSQGVGQVTIGGREHTIRDSMLKDFRSFDLAATIQGLTKPVMLIHSLADETLGFEHALRLYGFLTQKRNDTPAVPTSLICLPRADHLLVNHPADIPYVSSMMLHWFDRILAE